MEPDYLSSLFLKSDVPSQLRDNNKLTQPLKRTTIFGIKSLAYFGAHLWNLLPHHVKNSVSLCNFKSLKKKWSGPTCSCCVCTLVVWLSHQLIMMHFFFILNHIQIIKIIWVVCVQCTAVLFCSLKMTISHWIFCFKILYVQNVYNGLFILILLYPRPTTLEGGYTGFTLSVRPSVCRRHGFRSISQVCFGISISNFMRMLMAAIGRSLMNFSDVTYKMATRRPYWIFWFPDSNFTLALNINFKLQRHNTYVYG